GVDHGPVDRVDPGVVDEHVETAERLDGLGDDFRLVVGVIGLAGHRDGDLGTAELGHGVRQRLRAARGDAHPGTPPDKLRRDPKANAPASAGDDRDAILQRFHVPLPTRPSATHGDRIRGARPQWRREPRSTATRYTPASVPGRLRPYRREAAE